MFIHFSLFLLSIITVCLNIKLISSDDWAIIVLGVRKGLEETPY